MEWVLESFNAPGPGQVLPAPSTCRAKSYDLQGERNSTVKVKVKPELHFCVKLMTVSGCALGYKQLQPPKQQFEVLPMGWMHCLRPFPKWDSRLVWTRDFPALFKSGYWMAEFEDVCAVTFLYCLYISSFNNCILKLSWASQVALVVKNLLPMKEIQEIQISSLGQEDLLKNGMATHSTILARRIPSTEEPGGLWSIGLQRVRHDWSNLACTHTEIKSNNLLNIKIIVCDKWFLLLMSP